jgi:hypothetical protein
MISRFVFTRAIGMNLDPPFLYNPLNKNEEHHFDLFLGNG